MCRIRGETLKQIKNYTEEKEMKKMMIIVLALAMILSLAVVAYGPGRQNGRQGK